MSTNEHDVKIAVLEEQMRGIREQNKAQYDNLQSMLRKLFSEMDELKEAMNKGKGVFAASLTFAGLVGGAVSIALQWVLSKGGQ